MQLPNGNLVQFNQAVSHQMSSSGQYQYHTVHKDSGLYKELLHKLHLAKMGDCMGDSGDKPLRRNNSYTSYTMAICGMPLDSFRAREGEPRGEEMEKLTWPAADTKKRVRMDSYTSYCNAVADTHPAADVDLNAAQVEMGIGNRKGSSSSLEEWQDQDKPEVSLLFQFLQILTACFGSFAHGGNDVRSVELASQLTPSAGSAGRVLPCSAGVPAKACLPLAAMPSALWLHSTSSTRRATWLRKWRLPSGCCCTAAQGFASVCGCGDGESSRPWART